MFSYEILYVFTSVNIFRKGELRPKATCHVHVLWLRNVVLKLSAVSGAALQWELVCDRSVLTETSQMVLVAGVMVGSVVGSLVADA